MSKIQNEDIKSLSEIIADGGSVSNLPDDTKIYITATGINKTLRQAIIDGDISGGGGGGAFVGARYRSQSGQNINGSTFTTIVYETVEFDPQSAYNTTTGIYTTPFNGKYLVHATAGATISISPQQSAQVLLYVANVLKASDVRVGTNSSSFIKPNAHVLLDLLQGETLDVRWFSQSFSVLDSGPNGVNSFHIIKVD